MFDASAHRLSVPSSHTALASWLSRISLLLALSGGGLWVLMHLFSAFAAAGASDDAHAITRTASLVLLAGVGFVVLLACEALGGRADEADEQLDRSPHSSRHVARNS